jgi:hypothetical protein
MNTPFGPDVIDRIVAIDAKFTSYNTVRTLRLEEGRFEHKQFGRATAMRDPTHAARYYNRVVGFGELELERLDEIIDFYREVGKRCSITLTPDRATPQVLDALSRRGFGLAATNCVFGIRTSTTAGPPSDLPIRRAVPADIDRVLSLWDHDGRDPVTPEIVAKKASAQFAAEFPIYLIEMEGRAVAMASMFTSGGVAWLGNSETLPSHRRRSCQLALLHHRIREAAQMGCDLAVSDTEFGTTSHRNVERAGMRMIFQEMTIELTIETAAGVTF